MDPIQQLTEQGVLTADAASRAEVLRENGQTYEEVLHEVEVPRLKIKEVLAKYYQVPTYEIPEGFNITQEILNYIPQDSAVHYRVMPLETEDGILKVGSSNPDDLQMREALNFISAKNNLSYRLFYLLDEEITKLQEFYTNLKGDVGMALQNLESDLDAEIAASTNESQEEETYEHIEEDAPVTKIVATILRYAVDGKASDIHIEPTPTKVGVRFRVDGELATSLELPKNVHMAVVARVKILSSMRLDERRKPQDGRFSATFDDRKIDFRVSVLPTNHGEKVVMRILDNEKGVHSLEETGLAPENLDIIKRIVKEPYGIILISGPTGSGKSTTLYGMLGEVDRVSNNVMSLEDPIEYSIDGVSQSQVRPEIGYTFAKGLRASLRQDPDIIMVGEIRDKETAQLAIQAALTGHLVLSTIHTNNAVGVIPRLIDMGVDPYLIAPTLKLAIAQRLARRLCDGTGIEKPIDHSTNLIIDEAFKTLPKKYHGRIPERTTIMEPEKTPGCSTGMRGRTAVSEVLEINEEMQELILQNAPEEKFLTVARKNGFVSMFEDAIIKALKHEIPFEEMMAFRSQVGNEPDLPETEVDVDNSSPELPPTDIIKSDETPTN